MINEKFIGKEGECWETYMRRCIAKMIGECDEVHFLPDWMSSRGARIKYLIARTLGLKIVFVEPTEYGEQIPAQQTELSLMSRKLLS